MALRRGRAVVLVAALASAALTAGLGVWQLDRASQKLQLQAAIDGRRALPPLSASALARTPAEAAAQHHRKVELAGVWLPALTVYLENRQQGGIPGFDVVTPLRLDDGSAVLVQRGWLPRSPVDRTRVVAPPLPPGRVTVALRITPPPGRLHDFAGGASGAIRQNLDLDSYARETGLTLRPVAARQEDPARGVTGALPRPGPDGLSRHWPAPATDVARHHGYAFQWFALSALVIGLYVWFQIVRPRRRDAPR